MSFICVYRDCCIQWTGSKEQCECCRVLQNINGCSVWRNSWIAWTHWLLRLWLLCICCGGTLGKFSIHWWANFWIFIKSEFVVRPTSLYNSSIFVWFQYNTGIYALEIKYIAQYIPHIYVQINKTDVHVIHIAYSIVSEMVRFGSGVWGVEINN